MSHPHTFRSVAPVLAGIWLAVVPPSLVAQGQSATAAPASPRVAVILGNAPTAVDEPTTMQTARCLKAFDLYKNGQANRFIVTGGYTAGFISEARMMTIGLVTLGIPAAAIIEDELAATTIENGVFAAKLFEAQGWTKTATVVSQAFHLPRAAGNFRSFGFEVQDATAVDTPALDDYARVLDLDGADVAKAQPAEVIVVYEPYRSQDPMPWPTPALAARLRTAAALYHRKVAPTIVLYNDRYTRGPVNLAQMMKVGLMTLGVPASALRVIGRSEFRRPAEFVAAYDGKAVLLVTTATLAVPEGPGTMGAGTPGTMPPSGGRPAGAAPGAGGPPPGMMPAMGLVPPATWRVLRID